MRDMPTDGSDKSEILHVGLVSISDRASSGVYMDAGIPALRGWLDKALITSWQAHEKLIPDEFERIRDTLIDLSDTDGCSLILTTGGTGPAKRDITPEATRATGGREIPGFGEQMRQISLRYVPTAILSRQIAVVRNKTLIINLPGQPKAIAETLDGIFAAVPYCLDLIGAAFADTDSAVVRAFRPKPAKR